MEGKATITLDEGSSGKWKPIVVAIVVDNDGKMTSITRERQAATVPQVPLYFLADPAPFVVAPSGASSS